MVMEPVRAERHLSLAIAGLVALGLLPLGCSNKLNGSATAKLEEGGEFGVTPDECYSGQRESFFGVQLQDTKNGHILRVVKPATGDYEVLVKLPGSDKATRFTASTCSKFDVAVSRQNSTINDIANVEGRLVVECASGANTFSAQITFANCH